MEIYYRVKGSTDDVTSCDICGREDLRRTAILHVFDKSTHEFVEAIYAGVDCAARITGNPQHEMAQRIRNANLTARGLSIR